MARIAELDFPERLRPFAPRWLAQIAAALACTGLAVLLRFAIDRVAPGIGPFALIYPVVLIATLFAHWQAGALTAASTLLLVWYFILPPHESFALSDPNDVPRLIIIASSNLLLIAIAELFRRAVRRAADERDRQLAERDLFLAEFDHRVKNNFAVVIALLDLQRRRAQAPETIEALGAALVRVEGIARAHQHLYRGASAAPGTVDMATYLHDLCGALSEALLLGNAILLECEAEPAEMPRDRAVSIGLVVNELVTNAAKHAFPGRDRGTIQLRFARHPAGWLLEVRDDGIGIDPAAIAASGLGRRLLDAFARQAGGRLTTRSDANGTLVQLDLGA